MDDSTIRFLDRLILGINIVPALILGELNANEHHIVGAIIFESQSAGLEL
jgi:hypothetical protein